MTQELAAARYGRTVRQAAEIAAQVFTARDALLRDRAEDLRVAFLLFDSATETLMVRRINGSLIMGMWDWGRNAWRPEWAPTAIDLNDMDQRERLRDASKNGYVSWQLSKTQKGDIARDFDSKLRVLAWNGDIPREYVSVIGRMHEYRNEMYHREESRPTALRILSHLYAWLVADLLERLGPPIFGIYSGDPDDIVEHTYGRMGLRAPGPRDLLEDGFRIQNHMAAALREGLDLASAPELLADYAAERMESAHEAIKFSGDYIGSLQRLDKVSEMDVIRLIYNTGDPGRSMAQMRNDRAPVTRAMIERWDEWPEKIRAMQQPLEAFRSLAELEAEFESFEKKVLNLASDVDGAIQFASDLARGK